MQILGAIPFVKLQNNPKTLLNNEKWDVELRHLSAFGSATLFSGQSTFQQVTAAQHQLTRVELYTAPTHQSRAVHSTNSPE